MGKRAGASPAQTASKAAKVDLFASKCAEVTEALRQSRDLPAPVVEMLCETAPFSLKTVREERHEFQQGIVEAVGKELAAIEGGLEKAAGEAEARLGQLAPEKEAHETAVAELSAKLEERQANTYEHKKALAAEAVEFRTSKESLAEAVGKREARDQDVAASKGKCQELEGALREGVLPLKEGALDQAAVPEAAAALGPRLQRLFSLDESLLSAIPTVFAKEPAARGNFDIMVVDQLEAEAQKALEALEADAEAAEVARSRQADAVKAAEEALQIAKDRQRASAEAFVAVRREEEECEASLQAARQTLRSVAPEKRRREKALSQAQAALQDFRGGPLATFEELSGRSAQAPPSQEVAEGAASEQAAADASMAAADE